MELKVVGANRYAFTDEAEHRLVEGVKLAVLSTGDMSNPDRRGMEVAFMSAAMSCWDVLRAQPAVYDADLAFVNSRGKAVATVVSLAYMRDMEGGDLDAGSLG